MRFLLRRHSVALATALLLLFVVAGNAWAQSSRAQTAHRVHVGKIKLRFGKIVDTDTTAGDGQYNYAHGHANCKHGERLISGGLRLHHGNLTTIIGHFQMVESGPFGREWRVTASSDMGGAARDDFLVVASCEIR